MTRLIQRTTPRILFRYRTSARTQTLATALACFLGLPLFFATLLPSSLLGAVDGVSYTLTPVYSGMRWDTDVGLKNTQLWGGRLSYNLGQRVSLIGHYLKGDDVATRLGGLGLADLDGNPPLDQKLDVRNYGGDVQFNLGSGSITPFLKTGGGIMQFDSPDRDRVRTINLRLGGGFRFGIDRFKVEVFAEDSAFRIDRYRLAGVSKAGYPDDPEKDQIRHSLSIGAGVNFQLGGRRAGAGVSETDAAFATAFEDGLSGISVPTELFIGRLGFNQNLQLNDQDMLGIRSGLDFGRFFGIRGFYWRGMNDSFSKTSDIQSWGGEVRFNLAAGEGAIPYFVGGIGQLDFLDGYTDQQGSNRTDRSMLQFGGGMAFTVGSRAKIDISARNNMMTDNDLADASSPDDLFSNWMLGASVSFSLFGRSADGQRGFFETDASKESAAQAPAPNPAAATTVAGSATAAGVSQTSSSGVAAGTPGEPGSTEPTTQDATGGSSSLTQSTSTSDPMPKTGELRNYQGGQVVSLPVPIEGEIYIRYGQAGGVDIQSRNLNPGATSIVTTSATGAGDGTVATGQNDEAMRQVVQDELARAGMASTTSTTPTGTETPADPATASGPVDDAAVQATMQEQLIAMEQRLNSRMDEQLAAIAAGSAVTASTAGTSTPETTQADLDEQASSPESVDSDNGWSVRGSRAYVGGSIDHPTQALLGGRLNLGPVTKNSPFDLVPEFTLGSGEDQTSYLLGLNLMLPFRDRSEGIAFNPYAIAGLGFLLFDRDNGDSSTKGVFNGGLGASIRLQNFQVFAEYQGVDAFRWSRALVGFRVGR